MYNKRRNSLVHAQADSISQVMTESNILCREANPSNGKMFGNSLSVSMRFEYLPQ